jgi:hypothetical protein
MTSKAEVEAEMSAARWWRHADNWPDEATCERVWLLANAMLALWDACLVGNPAPRVAEMYERMRHPVIGDVVLETTTVWHKDWPERALGRLTAVGPEPGYPGALMYTIESLYFPDRAPTHWTNATLIALPIDESAYLAPPGRVVFTRESLTDSLTDAGFALRP